MLTTHAILKKFFNSKTIQVELFRLMLQLLEYYCNPMQKTRRNQQKDIGIKMISQELTYQLLMWAS
jgi:hypothetical protein